jgi:hypothetical protein
MRFCNRVSIFSELNVTEWVRDKVKVRTSCQSELEFLTSLSENIVVDLETFYAVNGGAASFFFNVSF